MVTQSNGIRIESTNKWYLWLDCVSDSTTGFIEDAFKVHCQGVVGGS